MKRVLMLAYLFPPIANSGTQRPMKFAKYLSEYGWEPIVVTAAHFDGHAMDPGMLEDIPENVRVVRVPMLHDRVADGIAAALGNTRVGRRLGDAVRWRLHHRRRVPDMYAWWQPTATRAAAKIFREIGFDAIFATGFPWSSLLIGREISAATGKPFVADFRDLWSGENLFRSERPAHHLEVAAERSVIESAHAVVTASQSIARQLANAYPHTDDGRFVTIHNGFDPDDIEVTPAPRSGKFRIVFTGVWKEGYNPSELYDTIDWIRRASPRLLDGVEVITAGFKRGEARKRGLDGWITEAGVLPHLDAVALMKSADLLYLSHVDPQRQWVVPGKLYEYLASGAPVLALTEPEKETAQIIRAVGGGIALSPEDPGTLYEELAAILRARRFEVPARNEAALAAFHRRRLTAKLADVLDMAATRMPATAPARPRRYPTFSAGSSAGAPTRSS